MRSSTESRLNTAAVKVSNLVRRKAPTTAEEIAVAKAELLTAKILYRVEQMVTEHLSREQISLTDEQRGEICAFVAEVGR